MRYVTTRTPVAVLLLAAGMLLATGCDKMQPLGTRNTGTTEPQAKIEAPPATPPAPGQPPAPEEPKAPEGPPPVFAGSHILIAYQGAMRANPNIKRSKEEAQKQAAALAEKVTKAPKSFEEVASKESDCPSAGKGGSLGVWPKGRMVPVFDQTIEKLKVGEISGVIESPFGFHVIRRDAPPPMMAGSHILVAYKGAMRAAPEVTRSKEEALTLAKELAEKVRKNPETLGELAKLHSACPSSQRGGLLGAWPKGQMVPEFDAALDKMKVGDISDPVETPFGYHVIRREDPDKIAQE